MPDRIEEVHETAVVDNTGVTTTKAVTTASSATKYAKAEMIVYIIVSVLEALLAIRILLSLLGANQANEFAHLIYTVTYPFAEPFFGLFGYTFQYGVSHFEIETIVAMVVYALIGWVITKLLRIGRV
jgi:hypothetical protein